MKMITTHFRRSVLLALLLAHQNICFSETKIYEISLQNHLFLPDVLEIPAGQKVKLIINNLDPTPEEFESYELNREKVIMGSSKGIVFIGPLRQGAYPFFGEFHPQTAQGKILVK